MNPGIDEGLSCWLDSVHIRRRPPLGGNLHVDVCVIGAGIAGLTTAYLLAKEGRAVAVLEDGGIGGGMTGYTTAHLANALDDHFHDLESSFGEDGARLAAESHGRAIDCIEDIAREEGIDCDFRRVDAYLFAPPGDGTQDLEKELPAAQRAGLRGAEWVARAPIAGFDTGPALRFPRQAQFHPLKYLDGLAAAFERRGGRLFCNTHAETIRGGPEACVTAGTGAVVSAGAIVVATNVPVNDRLVIHTKQAPYMTYVVALDVPAGAVTPALYWDTRQTVDAGPPVEAPYHYVRLARGDGKGSDLLIVGGEDHKTGQEEDGEERFAHLENWARARWPAAGKARYRWAGQVMEPADGLAFIGRNPMDADNVYIVTGDSGNGITHGTIAGLLLTDLIMDRPNPWARLYDPGRVKAAMAHDFMKENANVAAQYAKGWLGGGDVREVEDIPRGEGAVVRRGFRKLAVYRAEDGTLSECSAVCPHLKCVVGWNSVEKTWDCPCHGSRFDARGKVINGPANGDLAPASK